MYLCAQRVAQPEDRGGGQGINAFYYVHKRDPWGEGSAKPVLPETDPGVLEDSLIDVPPPGNTVRSYLDVVARDDVPIDRVLLAVAVHPKPNGFPVEWVAEGVWCRSGIDAALESDWHNEIIRLMARVLTLVARQVPA